MIHDILSEAAEPLQVREVPDQAHMSEGTARRRLEALVEAGKCERREWHTMTFYRKGVIKRRNVPRSCVAYATKEVWERCTVDV